MNGVDTYEADLKLKEQKEEAEKKAKEDIINTLSEKISQHIDKLNEMVDEYNKETGEKLEYITLNGRLTTHKARYFGSYTRMPIINLSTVGTHDKWWDELYKSLR